MTHPTFIILSAESRSQLDLLRGYLINCGANPESLTDEVVLLTALDICIVNLPIDYITGTFTKAKEA